MKANINRSIIYYIFIVMLISCDKSDDIPLDTTPPAEVTNLTASAGDSKVVLEWTEPSDQDFAQVQITFTPENNLVQPIPLSPGFPTKEFSGLENGVEYTFTIQTVDSTANKSTGVSVKATPVEPVVEEPTEMVDERDGKRYKIVKIGEQVWMAENLAYLPTGASLSANNVGSNKSNFTKHYYVYGLDNGGSMADVNANPAVKENFDKYGVMYNWFAAIDIPSTVTDTTTLKTYLESSATLQGIAPKGWHVPTDEDFKVLEATLGMSEETQDKTSYRNDNSEGMKLKSETGWKEDSGTDEFGFALLPSGRWKKDKFQFLTEYGYLWTSSLSHFKSKTDANGDEYFETRAWLRYVKYNNNGVGRANWEHFNGYAIRCVKDSE
ncbi:FISUMP domain-containing protein [Marinifilum caeruleilacunae]|uniref:DUF4959 domain-containing protein n=1 Tax=Marinifilum caeruleilacunae TaxID=2499076 RepID=A0ABX1WRK2_9BACT|nr:FISUMP domain-containing protein [Marinifilum caeruleilacunae]NOU58708.1 DUF4959 domain-containing protein [Marinifilum caeruleilacunae]